MNGPRLPYVFLLFSVFAFNLAIVAAPVLAMQGFEEESHALHAALSLTCHQLDSRSLCLFKSEGGDIWVGDCTPSSDFSTSRTEAVRYENKTGYKFPVCSRDLAIYLAMLAGLLLLPFVQRIESEDWPNRWILVAAAIPTAIDGVSQLVGLRESTNFIRVVTGVIIGMVLPFYLLPIVNSLYLFLLEKLGRRKKANR